MNPKRLLDRIDSGSSLAVVDVRSGWEYRRGRVPGAVHVPFWQVPARRGDLPEDESTPVVVYCGHGPRAWMARPFLKLLGYRDVRSLAGHWSGWVAAGMPVEK